MITARNRLSFGCNGFWVTQMVDTICREVDFRTGFVVESGAYFVALVWMGVGTNLVIPTASTCEGVDDDADGDGNRSIVYWTALTIVLGTWSIVFFAALLTLTTTLPRAMCVLFIQLAKSNNQHSGPSGSREDDNVDSETRK